MKSSIGMALIGFMLVFPMPAAAEIAMKKVPQLFISPELIVLFLFVAVLVSGISFFIGKGHL